MDLDDETENQTQRMRKTKTKTIDVCLVAEVIVAAVCLLIPSPGV